MKYLLNLLMFFMIMHGAASAAELRHYDVLVFPYDDDFYEMKVTELTHDSYKSYTLDRSLKEFKRNKSEDEGKMSFNIVFFNVIKYDTVDDWMKRTKEIVVINQKQGNDMTVIGEAQLGDHTRYLALANDISDDGRFGMIEYKVGYITRGRMLIMQIGFHGDTTNDAALNGFLSMANDVLRKISDGDAKPFTGSLELSENWRDQVKAGK